MNKVKLGGINALYPSLTTIVGADVADRANFMAIAHVGIMNHGTPQYISIGVHRSHYTNKGIEEHGEFSVCIPGRNLVAETDYVGIVTGKNTDKSQVFDVFRGDLAHAPMVRECPVCIECRLDRTVAFAEHDIFVGEIVQVHADENVLNNGKIDIAAVEPLLFDMASLKYWSLGQPVAGCWNEGKKIKEKLRA